MAAGTQYGLARGSSPASEDPMGMRMSRCQARTTHVRIRDSNRYVRSLPAARSVPAERPSDGGCKSTIAREVRRTVDVLAANV